MANCLKELRAALGSGEVNKSLVKPAKTLANSAANMTLEQAYLTVAKDNLEKLKAERKEIIEEITADHAKENPKEKAKLPKPDWWKLRTLLEQAELLNIIGAKVQPWEKLSADTQHTLSDLWTDSIDNENNDTSNSKDYVNNAANQPEIKDETDNGTTAAISDFTGKADNQSGISDQQQGSVKPQGTEADNGTVPRGKRQPVATDTGKGQGNELSGNDGMAGHAADGGNQQTVKQPNSENGSVSGDTGRVNYDLRDKPPIALTPSKRRDINNLAVDLLKKPVEDITEADKDILRQYTGNGGLDLNASKDKGASIFNQHYTAYDTIKAMYGALMDAGVKMDKVLEPSVGSGNFIGMFPEAEWTAVDIDTTNTEVVKRLYPEAKVFNESYETFRGKNYDLIISNVPFASFSSLARAHAGTIKPAFKAIHNFYFAQSVDKLKTGGVMAFMTSTGTMDGTKEAAQLRAHIVKEMDVIGAYRLPMGTQKANASTEVMIDVIFLQKRPEGVASKQPDKNQSFVNVASKDGHKINQYFLDYPEAVLGELSIGKNKTSMGKVGWIVTGEADYSSMSIDYQDYAATKKAEAKNNEFADAQDAQAYADKKGYQFVDEKTAPYYDNGTIYDTHVTYTGQEGGGLFGRKATGTNAEKLAALKKIDETHDAELVTQYETKYGKAPHSDKPLALWAKAHYAEQQLKSYLSLFDKHFELSEVFTKQVRFTDSGKIEIDEHSPLHDRAESLEDVDGRINTAKQSLVNNEEVQSLLDSGDYARVSDTMIQNSRLYYAGNIYQKLDDAAKVKPAAQRDKQIARLEKIKPESIPIKNISITGKENWLPDSAKAAIGNQTYSDGTSLVGTNAISDNHHLHLFNQYINNEPLVSKGKDETPEEYTERLKSAQNTLRHDVLPMIKQKLMDDGLADEVAEAYNRAKNFFAPPVFDGSSLRNVPGTFKGKPFKLMKHQQEGAERAIYNRKGVLAFAPGLGKTPTAIIIADQLLQKGVMKKPLFIVPANTIPQWESSARSLYPNAKVFEFPSYKTGINKGKVKDWAAMNATDKEKMVYDLTNNRYDYTFISTNLAQKFSVPRDKLSQYLDELTESITGMEKDDEELTKSQIKAKEQRLAKLAVLKTSMMRAYADNEGFDMGKLGFDAIFADEVQYYKNIGMQSEDAKGGIGANVAINAKYPKVEVSHGAFGTKWVDDKTQDPLSVTIGSSRSYDFRFKTRYISENNNGNNIFLLTGTPTPNKPLELMTLLHHLDTHILEEYGVNNVGEFVDEFLEVEEVEELTIDGSSKMKPQLTGIKNIPALKKIITRYVDYRSPESAADLKRPTQEDIVHTILRNDDAETVFADIQARILQSIEDAKRKMNGEKDVLVEPMIVMYTAGRDASVDVRLYSPTEKSSVVNEGTFFEKETRADYSKIAKTVKLVTEQNKRDPESGQLIFLDRLKFAGDQGSTHEDIRNDILKATGLDPKEVIFVNGGAFVNPDTGKPVKSGPKPEALQKIMDYYNEGKIKVLIGNTSKLGVGVDLQVTTTDIYQLDKPYRPDEIEQRNNRGVRQGNRNDNVRVHTFNQPGTFDAMSDRIIANKQGFNDVFWKDQEGDTADVKGEEAPNQYDAAIELEQNPLKKRKLEIERDLAQAAAKTTQIEKQISNLARRIRIANENKTAYANANQGIDTRETPKYEDQTEAERKKSVAAFKKRMAEQKDKNIKRIADIEADLVTLTADKKARDEELAAHKAHITGIRDQFVVNGVVSLDAIKQDQDTKASKNAKTTGSTKADIEALLPNRVKAMLTANKLVVVQGIKDLPDYLWDRGNTLAHTVWHGSPHDHDKFDSSKIGTGEGAQAFGYGLYFTDKKEIAEWYKETLAKPSWSKEDVTKYFSNQFDIFKGKYPYLAKEFEYWMGETYSEHYLSNGDIGALLKDVINSPQKNDLTTSGDKPLIDLNKKIIETKFKIDDFNYQYNAGKIYQVELAPSQDEYLDWDKPLSEQSEFVKNALANEGWVSEKTKIGPFKFHSNHSASTGKNIYQYWMVKSSDKEASKHLHSLGIRGIRYKAKAGKSEASNYVIFSDDDVSITNKYSRGPLANAIKSGNDLSGIEALYDGKNDIVYLVADMLHKDNLFPVLNHELFHRLESTDQKLATTLATFNKDFQKRFDDAAQGIGSEIELNAYKRVMAAKTREADRLHEFKAYMVTEFSKKPSSFVGTLKEQLQKLFAAIRLAMLKAGIPLRHLTPADLAVLARQGAKIKATKHEATNKNESVSNAYKFSRSEITNAITEALTPTKGQKSLGWTAGLFQRNHLIDMAVKHLPMLKDYKRLSQEKDSFINQSEQVIHDAYLTMQKSMDHKVMTELGRVQGLATRLKSFDPDTFDGDITDLSTEEQEVYEDFEAMPEAAKKAYRTMRDDYREDLEAKKKALIERINDFPMDTATQRQIIDDITAHFDKAINKGVYFPLSRNGDFVVIGKKFDEDGAELVEERVVEHVKNERIAEKVASEMEAQGYTQTKITLKDTYIASTEAAKSANKIAALAVKAIADLKTAAQSEGGEDILDFSGYSARDIIKDGEFDDLLDEFNQQLINALPDTSYRKHFIHRKGTLGYSTDTLRAYAGTRTSAAKTIAALKFDHKINKALESANQTVNDMGNTQEGRTNTVMLKSVMGELRLREDKLKTTDISQASQTLTSLGFMGALGFNVSSAAINMLQVPSMTLPELSGRYNFISASKAIKDAYGLLFDKNALDKQSGFDLRKHPSMSKPENAQLKRALEALSAIGKIDLTMTHEAVAMGRNPSYSDNAAIRAVGNVSKWAGYPFHVAEALNRQITGIAAFNLAYKKHGDFNKALEETIDVIDRTQFDYSMANRSRHMMGNTARVLTLFKAYAIGMSYYVGRNAHDAIAKLPSERRTEARKTLVVQMAMTFATSGLFGLPIGIEAATMAGGLAGFKYRGANFAIAGAVGANFAMQALLAGLGYDDDDELETDFRNWLTDNFNQTFAEFVTKGPARLLPLADISGRTGLSDLWWHKQNKELEGRDQFNAIANALMGPLGSQVQGLFVAKQMHEDGEYFRMFESAVPAALRNAIAAGRMANEGVKTIKGDPIIQRELSWDEIFAKVIGFNPDVVANASARNAAITRQADKTSMKKAHLVNRYVGANAQDRLELMRGDIKAFNATVPVQERITWASLRKSIKLRKSADKRTKGGVYLSKRQEHLRDIGRFAEPE